MSMTYSENYYTNVIVDKIYDSIDKGDKRAFAAIESELWCELVDRQQEKLESAEQLLKQLNTDLSCMEHTYIGKGSIFHRKVEEWLRQNERKG